MADSTSSDSVLDLRAHATTQLPRALAALYDRTVVGQRCVVRLDPSLSDHVVADVVSGGSFAFVARDRDRVEIERVRSLPDRVSPAMRVLMCGLNPSLYSADMGIDFARPGNRFWPAALASGLVSRDRDPAHALDAHGVGRTDLVKRATARAEELRPEEFVSGAARVTRLCELLGPKVLCVVGITGWRHAVDRRARVGPQPTRIGHTVVYVMHNPSGLNAHANVDQLAAHMREVAHLADQAPN